MAARLLTASSAPSADRFRTVQWTTQRPDCTTIFPDFKVRCRGTRRRSSMTGSVSGALEAPAEKRYYPRVDKIGAERRIFGALDLSVGNHQAADAAASCDLMTRTSGNVRRTTAAMTTRAYGTPTASPIN